MYRETEDLQCARGKAKNGEWPRIPRHSAGGRTNYGDDGRDMDQFFAEQWSIGSSIGIAIKLEVVFPDIIYQSIPARDAGYGPATELQ